MTWLAEIFESNSDKARLIAILVSALVALLILLGNQWFTNRRAKRDLLVKKIEELYLTSIEYTRICRALLHDLGNSEYRNEHGDFLPDREKLDQIDESIRKMEMISRLYFPNYGFVASEFYVGVVMPIVEIAEKSKALREGEAHLIYEDSRDNITAAGRKLGDICNQLMSRHGY